MSGGSSSDDEYDGLESSEDEAMNMISAMIRDGNSILKRTTTGGSTSGGAGEGYTFVNPVDRMINLEDEESQSSYTSNSNYYNRIDEQNLMANQLVGQLLHTNHHMNNNGNNKSRTMMISSSGDEEDDSTEMDESDTSTSEEEDEEMEDEEEDEAIVDLREWQICYPLNTSTLYTAPNSYFASTVGSAHTNQPIEISNEENQYHNETIFSLMPNNQKLVELIGSESPIIDYSFVLQTRSDDPSLYIPENLYTSLVYQFHQTVLFHEKIRKYEKIIAEIKLAFRDTGEEVQKIVQIVEVNQTRVPANLIPEKQGGVSKDVISGDIKALELMKPHSQREDPNSVMENRTKFNIDVVSAHYKNRAFTIQIRYYFPEDYNDDDLPFCVVQGAPFLTSARRKKPQRTAESKKRKKIQRLIDEKRARLQEIHGSNTCIQVPTPQSNQPISTLEDFSKGLRELIYFVALLPQDEKQRAVDMALRTLVQNDKDI